MHTPNLVLLSLWSSRNQSLYFRLTRIYGQVTSISLVPLQPTWACYRGGPSPFFVYIFDHHCDSIVFLSNIANREVNLMSTKIMWTTTLVCVCVCLGLHMGHFLDSGPLNGLPWLSFGQSDLTVVCPPFGSANSFANPLACFRQLFLNTPTDLLPLGGTYEGLVVLRLILERSDVTATTEFPCGYSRYPSDTRLDAHKAAK